MERVHTHNYTVYMHSIYNIYHKHTSNRRDRGDEESGVEGEGEGEEGEIVVSRPAPTLSHASLPLRNREGRLHNSSNARGRVGAERKTSEMEIRKQRAERYAGTYSKQTEDE